MVFWVGRVGGEVIGSCIILVRITSTVEKSAKHK